MDCTNGERMIFKNIIYIPKLKTNILILGNIDSQGCELHNEGWFSHSS